MCVCLCASLCTCVHVCVRARRVCVFVHAERVCVCVRGFAQEAHLFSRLKTNRAGLVVQFPGQMCQSSGPSMVPHT